MIAFLYGPDSYRRSKRLREIIERYKTKYGVGDIMSVDLEEEPEDWKKIKDFLSQSSLLVQSKLAVIKNSREVEEKDWVKLLKSHLETKDTFIIISDTKEPKKALSFLKENPVQAQEYATPEGVELERLIKIELINRKISFSVDAFKFFVEYLASKNDSTWFLMNELDKIQFAGFPAPVSPKNLKEIIALEDTANVPMLTNFIAGTKDYKKTLPVLEKFYLDKGPAPHLFNSLPYKVYGKDLEKLAACDLSIKSSGLDYEEALLDFVLSR